ncbi:conserved hypothetical protein [Mesorhizobium metallidurans STM 2683]|uniref:Uncharacterized protein n=1 Tax=Mesorhizobium metallidurans STM 2683 TaxID=1297569 RepID=M5FC34_9HYPH|nr:DUF6527 family protein [Mesorhizobium metallidurans]CCV09481.1 conserved hypothetical protein [Mesorhizobium metallidurans STM 2683]
MTDFRLAKVHYVPAALDPGVLYVSDEYKIAMHLCACGCGSKVPVSLGPAGWKVTERNGEPTVRPSIDSGQLPCSSHYFITDGRVDWLRPMSAAQTVAALKSDHGRREAHHREMNRKSRWWNRAWRHLLSLFSRG